MNTLYKKIIGVANAVIWYTYYSAQDNRTLDTKVAEYFDCSLPTEDLGHFPMSPYAENNWIR